MPYFILYLKKKPKQLKNILSCGHVVYVIMYLISVSPRSHLLHFLEYQPQVIRIMGIGNMNSTWIEYIHSPSAGCLPLGERGSPRAQVPRRNKISKILVAILDFFPTLARRTPTSFLSIFFWLRTPTADFSFRNRILQVQHAGACL